MSDASGDESSSVGVFSTDSSDEWSCSSHSFDEHAFGDDEENWTVQPYQFEPEIDDEEESQEMRVGDDRLEDRRQNTDWCSCGYCIIMPDVDNCKCCKEVPQLEAKLQEGDVDLQGQCFINHPWFDAVCLNPATLQTAYLQYRQQYGARAMQGNDARKFRHVSYRQVVRWCWGYLGKDNRVPLPSCIMRKVREVYPDVDGNYKGFKYPPLDSL